MQIGIIGVGMVGSSIAFSLASNSRAEKLILIDNDKNRAIAEAMDISHSTPFTFGAKVIAGDYADLKNAGIIIVTAGANQKVGETRLDLLENNVAIFKNIIPQILEYNKSAIIIIASNPVDIMTKVALELSGLPFGKVFGTGTVLDSARFRSVLGNYLQVYPKSVHANVIGEHGDSEVLLWSSASANTLPIDMFAKQINVPFDDDIKAKIDDEVRNSAYTIINGKGSTYFGIATAVLHICNSIMSDKHAILTISADVDGICYSMPTIISNKGIEKIIVAQMNDEEKILMQKSQEIMREFTSKALEMI